MEKEEIKSHIDEIIKRTFKTLKFVYDNQQENQKGKNQVSSHLCQENGNPESRLIFPKYSETFRDGETRPSEQELRFLFVEQFNK